MSKIIGSDAAFEYELKDEVAIIRLKKNAMKIATDVQTRDKYLNLLDQLEVDSHVSGLIQINDEAFPGEAELRKLMKRIIEDPTFEKVVAYRFRHWISQLVHRRLYFQKPIVAGMAGPVTMEGFGPYLICDRLIVSDHNRVKGALTVHCEVSMALRKIRHAFAAYPDIAFSCAPYPQGHRVFFNEFRPRLAFTVDKVALRCC